MKKKILSIKRLVSLTLATVLVAGACVGCGDSSASGTPTVSEASETPTASEAAETTAETATAAETEAASEAPVEVRKIIVATAGSPRPFTYTDENNQVQGYEVAVLDEVFSRLPQYELEYQLTEFASIFTGVDAGLYQIAMNCLGYNTDRAQKYLYSDVLNVSQHGILVREDDEDIQTVFDFAGHTTVCNPTNTNANAYQRYNDAHPDNPINVQYSESYSDYDSQVADGRIDFYYHTKINIITQLEETGVTGVKVIDVPFEDSSELAVGLEGTFVLFSKEDEQLAADFNQAFEEALAEGVIAQLQEEYLDLAPEDNILDQEYVEYARQFIEDDLKANAEAAQ